jgi:hypothetical protein
MFCGRDLNYANCWEHVMLKLFTFYKIMFWVWEHVMLKLFRFYEEIMFWMISKCCIKCWICLVLRERDLVTAWFLAWYSSKTYTGQAQSIEHVV